MTDADAASRRKLRESWPVRVYRLGEGPAEDLSASTTAAERIEMVWELSRRMWELTGKPIPQYDRAHMPVRIRLLEQGDSGGDCSSPAPFPLLPAPCPTPPP